MLKIKKHHRYIWMVFMSNKRLPPEERKEMMTVRIKKKYIDAIKEIPGYNKIIESMIEEYLKKNKD
jgi:hypothetical protein